ncbi:hypothetical protein HYU93_05165 [Candidatus Daviesbacteria bacterium]|nr:hypothetical protein [Candidatus Daviesbacteria bacterium]
MTTEITLTHIISGLFGGLIRAVVGITKDKSFSPDKFKFQWQYFLVSLLVAAIVGITSGIIGDGDWRISFLAGYAGTDFLENLYKLKFKEFFKS